MADIDLKTATPDTSLPTTGFLFGADSQAAASPSVYSTQTVATTLLGSTSLTGATITADAPVLNLAQTWNNAGVAFTGLKFNATDTASAAGSLLLELQTNTGGAPTTRFSVSKTGSGVFGLNVSANNFITNLLGGRFFARSDSGGFALGAADDVIIGRRAAANLRLGAADAAAPVAQTLSVQSVVAGTSNTAGTNFTITGSQGTGTGAGGSIIFQVAPAGSSGTAQNALADALTINSTRAATFASSITANGPIAYTNLFYAGGSYAGLYASSFLGWSNGNADGTVGNYDVRLFRDAANTLALRNGANAQTFNVYNTFTDASNYERAVVRWSSNDLQIGVDVAGTGATNRQLHLVGGTSGQIRFYVGATLGWYVNSSGHFLAGADNAYDIGASGAASRPRNVYIATSVECPYYSFNSRGGLVSNANGVFQFRNAANNDFDRLQFGGTTSSFPALKRNSTALETKLADDSAYAPHAMQYLDVTDGITAPASATGRARIYVDTADGDLKVIFADGTVKTIVTDT